MPYVFNTPQDQREMLDAIGAESIDELFEQIPAEQQLGRPLKLPPAMGELELTQHMTSLSAKNLHAENSTCFLGGGSYDHFVPSVIDDIASRGEFYTSYTPYQAEVSQGNLQAMFEYQTLICQLTGMDISNASLYDGGSAVAEAVLLCMSATRRGDKVVTSESVHPEYRQILETYFTCIGAELVTIPSKEGTTDMAQLEAAVDDKTACVLLQSPNFFGCIEDIPAAVEIAHEVGALMSLSFDPISLGLLRRPGEMGVDVAVAEGQSLGTPMQYGGPYLGVMTCAEKFVRRLPGRVAGQTVDRRGKRCWVLTLQAREQHIRRDKATSNICTNQGLFALRAAIYLAVMGPNGMQNAAELCAQKARYALDQITANERFSSAFPQRTFKEFVIRGHLNEVESLLAHARGKGVLAGIPLRKWMPELADCFLVSVTEQRTKQEIDQLANCLAKTPRRATIHA